jgi:hypothetical protein
MSFSKVLHDPISLLYLKAQIVATLVLGRGLAQAIGELQVNSAINNLLISGIDLNDPKAIRRELATQFQNQGLSKVLANSLANDAIALMQLESLSPYLNVAFAMAVELDLAITFLASMGYQEAIVGAVLDKTLQGASFETLRDFALVFLGNLRGEGMRREEAVALVVAAVSIFATGMIEKGKESDPLQTVSSNRVLTAQVLRELLVAHVIGMLTQEVGLDRAETLAHQIVVSLLGEVKGQEEDEDPIAQMKALLHKLQELLASLLSGNIPNVALAEGLESFIAPGQDFSFVLEKLMEPAKTLLGAMVAGSKESNPTGEILPPQIQV